MFPMIAVFGALIWTGGGPYRLLAIALVTVSSLGLFVAFLISNLRDDHHRRTQAQAAAAGPDRLSTWEREGGSG